MQHDAAAQARTLATCGPFTFSAPLARFAVYVAKQNLQGKIVLLRLTYFVVCQPILTGT